MELRLVQVSRGVAWPWGEDRRLDGHGHGSALARMGPMVVARPGRAAPNRASHIRTCRRRMAVVRRVGQGEATACYTREASHREEAERARTGVVHGGFAGMFAGKRETMGE